MKKEDATKTLDEGLARLADAMQNGRSDELKDYLRMMSRFHQYSFGNLMLILMQRPDATQVAGFHTWKEFGRTVKKGAKGIGIIAPCTHKKKSKDGEEEETAVCGFRMTHVFDVEDTEGGDFPTPPGVKGEVGDNLLRLEQLYRESRIQLEYGSLPPQLFGLSEDGKVTVRSDLSDVDKFAVGVHEFAHEKIHKGERKHTASKTAKETEAEAVAFVVCDSLGIESTAKSSDYLSLYQGSQEQLNESLDLIQKTSKFILERLDQVEVDSTSRPPEVSEPETKCDHTIHAVTQGGELTGSWTVVSREERSAVVCEHCGRFYGYMRDGEPTPSPNEEEPVYRTGRADYEERREARIERYQDRADRNQKLATKTHDRARKMASAIPFGQPILVGHHSEKRDRNYRERIHNTFGKSFELQDKAKHWERRADAAENSTAISSDDPEAIPKLEAKLADLEDYQQQMKNINASWRAAGKPKADDLESWQRIAQDSRHYASESDIDTIRDACSKPWHIYDQPFPPYCLSNNNAEMRRTRQHIEELKAGANAEHVERDRGVCTYVENVEENRVQLVFDGKPPEETRKILKQNGFRWSRRNTAWQRQLNSQGKRAADYVIGLLEGISKPSQYDD